MPETLGDTNEDELTVEEAKQIIEVLDGEIIEASNRLRELERSKECYSLFVRTHDREN